jgi:hypothetical protein
MLFSLYILIVYSLIPATVHKCTFAGIRRYMYEMLNTSVIHEFLSSYLDFGTDTLSRNVGKQLPHDAA